MKNSTIIDNRTGKNWNIESTMNVLVLVLLPEGKLYPPPPVNSLLSNGSILESILLRRQGNNSAAIVAAAATAAKKKSGAELLRQEYYDDEVDHRERFKDEAVQVIVANESHPKPDSSAGCSRMIFNSINSSIATSSIFFFGASSIVSFVFPPTPGTDDGSLGHFDGCLSTVQETPSL